MSELIVASFQDKFSAEQARIELQKLEHEHLIDLEDAVVVVRKEDGKINISQLHTLTAAGALGGGFWGLLIGLLFLNPLFGFALGAAFGAVSGALTDIGVNDKFIKELSESLPQGSSALFVLVRRATPDKVIEELKPFQPRIIHTSLSKEDEDMLRSALEKVRAEQEESRQEVNA